MGIDCSIRVASQPSPSFNGTGSVRAAGKSACPRRPVFRIVLMLIGLDSIVLEAPFQ